MYEVEQDFPEGGQVEEFANLKEALSRAREISKEETDKVFIYYRRRNGDLADRHWIIDPMVNTYYE